MPILVVTGAEWEAAIQEWQAPNKLVVGSVLIAVPHCYFTVGMYGGKMEIYITFPIWTSQME